MFTEIVIRDIIFSAELSYKIPDFISNPQSESGDVLDESVWSEVATREVEEQV